jgi:hypothetical protein
MSREAHSAGKGWKPRNVNRKKYGDTLDRIFGEKPIKVWNPNEEEEKGQEDTETGQQGAD